MGFSERIRNFRYSNSPTIVEEVPFRDFIFDALSRKVSSIPVWYDYEYEKQFELIMNFLDSKMNSEFEDLVLADNEKREIAEDFLKSNMGFGILDRLIARDDISSIFVNSLGSVYTSTPEGFVKTDLVLSQKQFQEISQRFSNVSAITRARLHNLQVTLIKPPVADNILIIKKIKDVVFNLSDLTSDGVISKKIELIIRNLLENRKNIIIASSNLEYVDNFAKICFNSIKPENRIAYIEDNGGCGNFMENVSEFSLSSLDDFDLDYVLSSIFDLKFDYQVSTLADNRKFVPYYLKLDPYNKGLITEVRGLNVNDVALKFISASSSVLKSTDKQAKLRFSSIYDYLIYLEPVDGGGYLIDSIMKIDSTKTSSLIMNEFVKFVDGDYVVDIEDDEDLTIQTTLSAPEVRSFRARLK